MTTSKREGYLILQFLLLQVISKETVVQLVLFYRTLRITLQLLGEALSTLKWHLCLRPTFFII